MNSNVAASRLSSRQELLQAAEIAWKKRDYQKGIALLERAAGMTPADPRILLNLGRCHGLCHEYAAAEQCFEKAIRLTGQKKETVLAVGMQWLNFGRHEMAGHYFERLLKRDSNSIEALVRLAEIRERQNRLDQAGELVERALKLNPVFGPTLLVNARLQRQAGRLTEAETGLRSLLPQTGVDPWIRSNAWYELGTILDRQERFDDAMAAFLEAKALVKPTEAQTASRHAAHADLAKTMETVSAGLLQRWRDTGTAFEPQHQLAVLCGHPRSGTTLLEQVLDAHPGIVSLEETGIFFEEAFIPLGQGAAVGNHFMPVLDSATLDRLQRSRIDYIRCAEQFLGQSLGSRLLVDKNPSLLALIPAFFRIFPETRFLMALRDPRDVCLSCFMQPIFPTHTISSTYLTLESTVIDYTLNMRFWQTLKPILPAPFLEVRYEDLTNDLESVARRILEFLGVPWDDRVLEFHKHVQSKVVRSPSYADVRKPITRRAVGRWHNYQKYLEPYLPLLDPFAKEFGYQG